MCNNVVTTYRNQINYVKNTIFEGRSARTIGRILLSRCRNRNVDVIRRRNEIDILSEFRDNVKYPLRNIRYTYACTLYWQLRDNYRSFLKHCRGKFLILKYNLRQDEYFNDSINGTINKHLISIFFISLLLHFRY